MSLSDRPVALIKLISSRGLARLTRGWQRRAATSTGRRSRAGRPDRCAPRRGRASVIPANAACTIRRSSRSCSCAKTGSSTSTIYSRTARGSN